MLQNSSHAHWNQVALRWHHIGPPLRPCAEDIDFIEKAVSQWRAASTIEGLQAMMCGVTPEIADMKWPPKTQLVAIERSQAMIEMIWPGGNDAWRQAQTGDWLHLPFDDHSFDVVIGDGIFNLASRAGHRDLSASLRRVIKSNGLLVVRFFVQAEEQETQEQVFTDLQAGKIQSFHAFKWRLAMALQPDTQSGIAMNCVWQAWKDSPVKREALKAATGWTQETMDTLNLYEGKDTRLTFLTLEEIRDALGEDFYEISVDWPGYELGDRCPILALCPRLR